MIIRNRPITISGSSVAHASQRGNHVIPCCLCHAMKRDLLLCHNATPTLGSVGYYLSGTCG